MRRYVALFRAVNVGGHGKVAMSDLREMGASLGFDAPRTVLQTGNLVFGADTDRADALEQEIEKAATARLGLKSDVMVRDADSWQALVEANPFQAEARADPAHLVLLVLKGDPSPSAQTAVEAAVKGRERVHVSGRSAYVVFPDGIGRSKLTIGVLERCLGTRATGRNWNSVAKIGAALAP